MNRFLQMAVMAAMITLTSSTLWAAEAKTYKWSDKVLRGAINIVSSPLELPRTIRVTTEEKNGVIGWTLGFTRGIANSFIRLGAGCMDLLTFPLNFPKDGKAPLIEPEFV